MRFLNFRQVGDHAGLVTSLQSLSDACGLRCHFYGQTNYPDAYKLLLKGTVNALMPNDFEPTAEAFYNGSFHVFCHRRQRRRRGADLEDSTATNDTGEDADDTLDEEGMECHGCK